ncbi:hypothetical protein [Hydrogenivirga sp.]
MQKSNRCPFCVNNSPAEVKAEIVSKKTGEVLGVATMCRECFEAKNRGLNQWFEYRETEMEGKKGG